MLGDPLGQNFFKVLSLVLGDRYIKFEFLYKLMKVTAIIKKGEKQYVALCPEVDVASQGTTVEKALLNLKEAIELHIEVMGLPDGISNEDALITSIEVKNNAKASTSVR